MRTRSTTLAARRSRRRFRWGFTLVELLVVTAIICVLAALLLPALQAARERGRRAVCLSNQRQIYVAAVSFTSDHNGILPPSFSPFGGVMPKVSIKPSQSWGPQTGLQPAGTPFTWAADFIQSYFALPLTNGCQLTSMRNVLYCPSGYHTASNIRVADGTPMQETEIDYAVSGASVAHADNGFNGAYALMKADGYWQTPTDGRGEIVFSFDSGDRGGGHTPHANYGGSGGGANAPGMNIMTVNGSGRWISQSETRLVSWHSPWVNWQLVPKNYRYVLYAGRPGGVQDGALTINNYRGDGTSGSDVWPGIVTDDVGR